MIFRNFNAIFSTPVQVYISCLNDNGKTEHHVMDRESSGKYRLDGRLIPGDSPDLAAQLVFIINNPMIDLLAPLKVCWVSGYCHRVSSIVHFCRFLACLRKLVWRAETRGG